MRLLLLGFLSLTFVDSSLGVEHLSNIVGGKPVVQDGLPFMAHLIIENKPECGGALIGDKWIITAAHCLVKSVNSVVRGQLLNIIPSKIQVILGTVKSNSTTPYTINQYTLAPDFDIVEYKNDIAIIELSTSVQFTNSIQPIGVSQQPVKEKQIVTAAGWGSTETQNFADTLYEVNLEIGAEAKCATVVNKYAGLGDSRICVINSLGHDTCYGDSGGPLFYKEAGQYSMLGVTSYGLQKNHNEKFKCGDNNTYGVYTRLASFTDFIRNVTGLTEAQLHPGYYTTNTSISGGIAAGAESTTNKSEKVNGNNISGTGILAVSNLLEIIALSYTTYLIQLIIVN
ncbi:hypothetical protein K7432_017103 [Basidiobolus ranarum]|uniref:Peptidase S1 domain-containing protein n=1 Tax=Basidiobolus ranarum TaxID=34480 RepID=A0ABR2WDT5_9FUNG